MVKAYKAFEISGVREIHAKLEQARRSVFLDMRPLFEILASDFYKDEKRIFQLKSKGKYQDLSKKYKERKRKKYGFIYPILFATGRLARSLLSRNTRDSVNIITPKHMIIGTKVPYAIFHNSQQRPRRKMPYRMIWDETEGGPLSRRWKRSTDRWLEKAMGAALK